MPTSQAAVQSAVTTDTSPRNRLFVQVGSRSAVYTLTMALQNGTMFLLLPVYTRYFSPAEYGILAVVAAVNAVVGVFFTLALQGAMARYYFEYRDRPEVLREFWGTQITMVLLASGIAGGLILGFGEAAAALFGDVPFWPYLGMGLLTAIFQPMFMIFQVLLQIRERALRFAVYSLSHFLTYLALVITFVIVLGWGILGALAAALTAAVIFFSVSLYGLRNDFRFCLRTDHLRKGLGYSLPLIPHWLASQVSVITDRMLLNALLGTAAAGVYYVGFLIGSALQLVSHGADRAYGPASMAILKRGHPAELKQLRAMGLLLVVTYTIAAALIAMFAADVVQLVTTREFHESFRVVPLIAFAFVVHGMYLLFVNILFFETRGTRFIPLGTGIAAIANVALNLALVPAFGLPGAAIAAVAAQVCAATAIAVIGAGFEPLPWPYMRFAAVFTVGFATSVAVVESPLNTSPLFKAGVFLLTIAAVSLIAWRDPWYLVRRGHALWREWASGSSL